MNRIKDMLKKEGLSFDELMMCFEVVKDNGDVAVVKFDGQRDENNYTVFISFPIIKSREMIRVDDSNLRSAMVKVLTAYAEVD